MRTNQTHMELCMHRCIKIRVSRHYPDIANAIALEILTEDSGLEITFYHLEKEDTDKMLKDWADDQTTISHGQRPADAEDEELEQLLVEELEAFRDAS